MKFKSHKSILKIESTTVTLTIKQSKKKIETKNILIYMKTYKDLVIYFTRYVHSKLIKNVKSSLSWIIGEDWKTWGTEIFEGWWLYTRARK